MPSRSKLLFIVADGGRARLLERSPENGHYVTIEEIDATARLRTLRAELRASPPPSSFSSATPRRSTVGRQDYLRPAKEAFVGEVADRAVEICRRREFEGVVVAAPSRLIPELLASLEGRARIAGSVRKDLTKAPNSELGTWLNHIYSAPQAAR